MGWILGQREADSAVGGLYIPLALSVVILQMPAQLIPFSRLKLSQLRVVKLAVLCIMEQVGINHIGSGYKITLGVWRLKIS